jgi:hypothetical protein
MKLFLRGMIVALLALIVLGQAAAQGEVADTDAVSQLLTNGSQAVALDELVLEERFDSDDAWEAYQDDSINLKVSRGVYRMVSKGTGLVWGLNADLHSNVVIEADAEQISTEDNNSYGIICRADTSNNSAGYYFRISGDGFYAITLSDGQELTQLVEWTASDAINQGQDTNRVMVVCVDDYLAMYVNGELVAEANDDTYTEGFAGLAVSVFEEADVDVAFDNVHIWEASPGSGLQTGKPEKPPLSLTGNVESLTEFAGDSEDALAELESLGIIPSGTTFIFGEDFAFFSGQGNWFQPLASDSPRQNIVLAGELTFTVGDTNEFEICTLTSRINRNNQGDAVTYVDVGLVNDGTVAIIDRFSETEDLNFMVADQIYDLDEPHHLLITMIDDQANVYVDGELAIASFTVAPRAGTYGIALTGEGPNARCEGRNIWAYQVPSSTSGNCTVSSGRNVNKRTGPGTDFDAAGQLNSGQSAVVIGQDEGADGFIWWQLEDETWVREDIVNEAGDCLSVPDVG